MHTKSKSPTTIDIPQNGWDISAQPTSPGEILQEEFLNALPMTQSELSQKMGVDIKTINKICNGHTSITARTALGFAEVFGTTPEFWLNLQNSLDLWRERNKRQK